MTQGAGPQRETRVRRLMRLATDAGRYQHLLELVENFLVERKARNLLLVLSESEQALVVSEARMVGGALWLVAVDPEAPDDVVLGVNAEVVNSE